MGLSCVRTSLHAADEGGAIDFKQINCVTLCEGALTNNLIGEENNDIPQPFSIYPLLTPPPPRFHHDPPPPLV